MSLISADSSLTMRRYYGIIDLCVPFIALWHISPQILKRNESLTKMSGDPPSSAILVVYLDKAEELPVSHLFIIPSLPALAATLSAASCLCGLTETELQLPPVSHSLASEPCAFCCCVDARFI